MGSPMDIVNKVILVIGLLLYLPLLFVTAMSTDSPGSGQHWAHWFFMVGNAALGPFCLFGLSSPDRRRWGLVGIVICLLSWVVLQLVCNGRFTCS